MPPTTVRPLAETSTVSLTAVKSLAETSTALQPAVEPLAETSTVSPTAVRSLAETSTALQPAVEPLAETSTVSPTAVRPLAETSTVLLAAPTTHSHYLLPAEYACRFTRVLSGLIQPLVLEKILMEATNVLQSKADIDKEHKAVRALSEAAGCILL